MARSRGRAAGTGPSDEFVKPIKLVHIVGARPQFIKLAPVSRAIARRGGGLQELIVHTGQHYDPLLSQIFFEELQIPPPVANLAVGSGSHARQTAAMLEGIEAFLRDAEPAAVVVYGDTNTTLAGALAASKLMLPLVHVEAGLRSHNREMPEELNRVLADHASDLLLAPTSAAMENLRLEGLEPRSRWVGDVMYDAVLETLARGGKRSQPLERLNLVPGQFGLATVHRAESTRPENLARALRLLNRIAEAVVPLVFPVHPRTRDAIQAHLPDWKAVPELTVTEPLGSLETLMMAQAAALVATDSGGLQKEAFMLGCPCVTLRTETEWLETLEGEANVLVGLDAEAALRAARRARDLDARRREGIAMQARTTYGEGHAASRCVEAILDLLAQRARSPAMLGSVR